MTSTMCLTIVSLTLCLLILQTEANTNTQSWSIQTYLNVNYTLSCNDTETNHTFNSEDTGTWRKLGNEGELTTDENYQLVDNNIDLVIRNVTDSMAGIYICEVFDKDGGMVYRAVKGVNIHDHLYGDLMDQYGTNIITGVITAGCVIFFVISICLVERFRYLTDEQKDAIRKRELRLPVSSRQPQPSGADNTGMVHDMDPSEFDGYGATKTTDGTTNGTTRF